MTNIILSFIMFGVKGGCCTANEYNNVKCGQVNHISTFSSHRLQSLTNRKVKIKNSSAIHSPAHYSANTHVNTQLVCNSLL